MVGICTSRGMDKLEHVGSAFFNKIHKEGSVDIAWFRKLWEAAHSTGKGVLICEFQGDVPKGLIGVMFHPDLWNGEKVATVVCWYSEGKEGLKLFSTAEEIAVKAGCQVMNVQHMADDARISKLFIRKGYTADTCMFRKEL
jgi:hypothetical protein